MLYHSPLTNCKKSTDFIWNGNEPKIKHSTLTANYQDRGYKGIGIASALNSLKILWITGLCDKKNRPIKVLVKYMLKDVRGIVIFRSNLRLSSRSKSKVDTLQVFYNGLISIY